MSKFIVIETNSLTPLTVNSIKRHQPDADIKTVPLGEGGIATALSSTNKPAFVINSGVVFRATSDQLPHDMLRRNPLAVTDPCVFGNHPKYGTAYAHLDMPDALGNCDLSIFHMVPELWKSTPPSDNAGLANCKKLWMPRYMNHKTDKLVPEAISQKDALYYGALGVPALALNYVPNLIEGSATPPEQAAYCFDHLAPYTSGLDRDDRSKLQNLIEKTATRYAKMRDNFAQLSGLKNAKADL